MTNIKAITTVTLAAAERIEQSTLDTVGIYCELAEYFIAHGVADGTVTKACKAVDTRLDLTMKGSSFATRMVEAVKFVKATGGTAAAADEAIERFNAERIANNRKAVSSLQNADLQTFVGLKAVKAVKAVSAVDVDKVAASLAAKYGANTHAIALAMLAV